MRWGSKKVPVAKLDALVGDMVDRVHEGWVRLRAVANQGQEAAVLSEGRALVAQVRSLVELLEMRQEERRGA